MTVGATRVMPGSERHSSAGGLDGHARAALRRAIHAHQGGSLDVAEYLYRRVLAKYPQDPDAKHYLGVLLHRRGRSDEGVRLIEEALERVPDYVDAWNNLGNVHHERGQLVEALACYQRVLDRTPSHANVLGNVAMALEALDRLDEARQTYANYLEVAPGDARAHYLMGLFLRNHAESLEHVTEAAERFHVAFRLDPRMLMALQQEGVTLYLLGRVEEARDTYRAWLQREPDNPVARHMLAATGGAEAPARADDDYVRSTFDSFADSFDEKLLGYLNYRAPQVLADALGEVVPHPDGRLDVLDAGCGTGLCAPLLRPYAHRLTGLDLSPGMIAKARERGGYDELVVAELTTFLQGKPAAWDVVLSADTLVYFGDLAPVFESAWRALRAGGWFVFSLEAMDGDGFALSSSGRYQHARAYVEATLVAAGFDNIRILADSLRKEAGQPVASWVALAQHKAGDNTTCVPIMQTECRIP